MEETLAPCLPGEYRRSDGLCLPCINNCKTTSIKRITTSTMATNVMRITTDNMKETELGVGYIYLFIGFGLLLFIVILVVLCYKFEEEISTALSNRKPGNVFSYKRCCWRKREQILFTNRRDENDTGITADAQVLIIMDPNNSNMSQESHLSSLPLNNTDMSQEGRSSSLTLIDVKEDKAGNQFDTNIRYSLELPKLSQIPEVLTNLPTDYGELSALINKFVPPKAESNVNKSDGGISEDSETPLNHSFAQCSSGQSSNSKPAIKEGGQSSHSKPAIKEVSTNENQIKKDQQDLMNNS